MYTALTDIHALCIRKEIWFDVLSSNPEIGGYMSYRVLQGYVMGIRNKVSLSKKRQIKAIMERKDYTAI